MVVIAIDFGTANCYVAVVVKGKVIVLKSDHGKGATPTYVSFAKEKTLVGVEAEQKAVSDPANTVFDIKRLMGRYYGDAADGKFTDEWAFATIKKGTLLISPTNSKGKVFRVEEVAAIFLQRMKEMVEAQFGFHVTGAVITVPASFSETQKQSIRKSARLAGITPVHLVNETTAVAVAYRNEFIIRHLDGERHLMIFHFGAGSSCVTIVKMLQGNIQVLSHWGIRDLGGNDFDSKIIQYWIEQQRQKGHFANGVDDLTKAILRKKCSELKEHLSMIRSGKLEFYLPHLGEYRCELIDRHTFQTKNASIVSDVLNIINNATADAFNSFNAQITDVIVVGGPARVLGALDSFTETFKKFEMKRRKWVNEAEAAVIGAAIFADHVDHSETGPQFVKETSYIHILDGTDKSLPFQIMRSNAQNASSSLEMSQMDSYTDCQPVERMDWKQDEWQSMAASMDERRNRDHGRKIYEHELNALDEIARGWLRILRGYLQKSERYGEVLCKPPGEKLQNPEWAKSFCEGFLKNAKHVLEELEHLIGEEGEIDEPANSDEGEASKTSAVTRGGQEREDARINSPATTSTRLRKEQQIKKSELNRANDAAGKYSEIEGNEQLQDVVGNWSKVKESCRRNAALCNDVSEGIASGQIANMQGVKDKRRRLRNEVQKTIKEVNSLITALTKWWKMLEISFPSSVDEHVDDAQHMIAGKRNASPDGCTKNVEQQLSGLKLENETSRQSSTCFRLGMTGESARIEMNEVSDTQTTENLLSGRHGRMQENEHLDSCTRKMEDWKEELDALNALARDWYKILQDCGEPNRILATTASTDAKRYDSIIRHSQKILKDLTNLLSDEGLSGEIHDGGTCHQSNVKQQKPRQKKKRQKGGPNVLAVNQLLDEARRVWMVILKDREEEMKRCDSISSRIKSKQLRLNELKTEKELLNQAIMEMYRLLSGLIQEPDKRRKRDDDHRENVAARNRLEARISELKGSTKSVDVLRKIMNLLDWLDRDKEARTEDLTNELRDLEALEAGKSAK